MEIDRRHLPEDPAGLQQMVVGLLEERDRQEQGLRQARHRRKSFIGIAVPWPGAEVVAASLPPEPETDPPFKQDRVHG